MNTATALPLGPQYWFVGAYYDTDQSDRFIEQGIWENGWPDQHHDLVRQMRPGDRIAIKSSATQKIGLPFEYGGRTASAMKIKAIGVITENLNDGRHVRVDWTPIDPARVWYFHTNRTTIWRVSPGSWKADALIAFAFENRQQDYGRFLDDRFVESDPFGWTSFYDEVATKLLNYRADRKPLLAALHEIDGRLTQMPSLNDQLADGTIFPLQDICPFTVMGAFCRNVRNRAAIAQELARFLGVDTPVPDAWEGVPLLNPQRAWFFGYSYVRQPGDIDALWSVFEEGAALAAQLDEDARQRFITSFDEAQQVRYVGWNLTMGLFWARPFAFPTLDGRSRPFLQGKLEANNLNALHSTAITGQDYVDLIDHLQEKFADPVFGYDSFPALSLAAFKHQPENSTISEEADPGPLQAEAEAPIYGIENILQDGSFLGRLQLEKILERLRDKKNLILQGPPGTGKTWLARRLAYALVGSQSNVQVRTVQFHANLSYEDFVRGLRPGLDGKLTLTDGPLLEMIEVAKLHSSTSYVLVIEEINRGNPAQILGEMLTLIEEDKRKESEAMELTYRRENERTYVPPNLHFIGTMNFADRSLAMVDLALRRRFAFFTLEPQFNEAWLAWSSKKGIAMADLKRMKTLIDEMNREIVNDPTLGAQFQVGHSFFTPSKEVDDVQKWFEQKIETEIAPLLEEYWFDRPSQAIETVKKLRL